MSHIHIPDGVIPIYWWISAYILTFGIMFFLFKKVEQEDLRKKVPFTGVTAAVMLIFMTIPLGIVPLHLSLAVFCGILVGPKLGFVAVFVVNIILALFGHGGITVVGINTLVIGSEVLVGFYAFRFISARLNKIVSSVLAVTLALFISTTFMVGVVGASVGFAEALPHHAHAGHEHEHEHEKHKGEAHEHEHEHSKFEEALEEIKYLSLTGWGALAAIYLAGIALEASVTALIIAFIMKRRPDFILTNGNGQEYRS
jgi:cobalt/nickel transport system permease protein